MLLLYPIFFFFSVVMLIFVFSQGVECGGQKLLIKFPDNPIQNGGPHGTITLRKTPTTTTTTPKRY